MATRIVNMKHSAADNTVLPFGQDSSVPFAKAFTDLRAEFVALGYGVPPELVAKPHRMDQ